MTKITLGATLALGRRGHGSRCLRQQLGWVGHLNGGGRRNHVRRGHVRSRPVGRRGRCLGAVSVASGSLGSYLVDASGKAIYILTSDKPGGASACTTACLKFWPPVAAPSPLPSGISGVTATFGTFKAADGSSELTINGYPAYNFVKDTGPGTTAGQGMVSFGGTWWLVSPVRLVDHHRRGRRQSNAGRPRPSAATGGGAYGY